MISEPGQGVLRDFFIRHLLEECTVLRCPRCISNLRVVDEPTMTDESPGPTHACIRRLPSLVCSPHCSGHLPTEPNLGVLIRAPQQGLYVLNCYGTSDTVHTVTWGTMEPTERGDAGYQQGGQVPGKKGRRNSRKEAWLPEASPYTRLHASHNTVSFVRIS